MRKRRVRQAAEINDVRARCAHCARALKDCINAERGCIDDFGENSNVVARKVEIASALSEIRGQILELLGPALEGHAEIGAQAIEIGAAPARQQHARRIQRTRQPAHDDRFCHEGCDLHADVDDRPAESRIAHAGKNLFQTRLRQVPGKEGDAFAHVSSRLRRANASLNSVSASTTATSLNVFSRAVFCRSISRGYTFIMPLGASVSSSGAVSQANTMDFTRHFPACAKTLVASVSEIPSTHLATVFEVSGASTNV